MSDDGPAVSQPQRERSSYTMTQPPEPQPVRIIDFDMPFGSMVGFMVKWAIAAIPAFLLLAFVAFGIGLLFSSLTLLF